MRSSRLPAIKTLADFDFFFQPPPLINGGVKREQIGSLHELGFLERKENVVFLGPPGVGKTHWLSASPLQRLRADAASTTARSQT